MEKPYKRVPFDIELAKKIQSGEIEGRILYFGLHGYNEIIILSYNYNSDKYGENYPIRFAFVNKDKIDYLPSTNSLCIELPEEMPKHKFKPFDKVKIHSVGNRYDEWIATVTYMHGDLIGVIVNHQSFVYDSKCIELVESDKEQHEFKPFDKVLVRRCKGDTGFLSSEWIPAFFQKHNDNFAFPFLASGMYWYECIHYEGNEHLVGTTNKPKED